MKKWIILFAFVSVLSISLVAFAGPDEGARTPPRQTGFQGPGPGAMPGPMAGPGQRFDAIDRLLDNPRAAERLGLTDDQVAQLKTLHLQAAKDAIPLRGAAELAGLELREAMSQDAPDEDAVMSAIDRLHRAEAALQKSQVRSRLAARGILGPEAVEKLQQHARQRMQERMAGPDQPDRPERPLRRQGPRGPMGPIRDAE